MANKRKTAPRTSKRQTREEDPGIRELAGEITAFEEMDARVEAAIARQVHEIKAISYATLFLAAVLVALAIGYLLRAYGF
ncbi:hypothetical protein AUJ14_01185 [Candidatus Micrarchaeota archaeon CG1_02_55_22]|nr:MAG: hypothetical protein AUJ14_01185 [Candidatus Micrarchaeota archaeon CG1_02_55_22]